MIKKLTALMFVVCIGLSSLPTTVHAQSNDKKDKKIKRFFKKLKKLPNAASRPGKVNRFARKLVRLDPKKARRYYKVAMLKQLAAFVENKAIVTSSRHC